MHLRQHPPQIHNLIPQYPYLDISCITLQREDNLDSIIIVPSSNFPSTKHQGSFSFESNKNYLYKASLSMDFASAWLSIYSIIFQCTLILQYQGFLYFFFNSNYTVFKIHFFLVPKISDPIGTTVPKLSVHSYKLKGS